METIKEYRLQQTCSTPVRTWTRVQFCWTWTWTWSLLDLHKNILCKSVSLHIVISSKLANYYGNIFSLNLCQTHPY